MCSRDDDMQEERKTVQIVERLVAFFNSILLSYSSLREKDPPRDDGEIGYGGADLVTPAAWCFHLLRVGTGPTTGNIHPSILYRPGWSWNCKSELMQNRILQEIRLSKSFTMYRQMKRVDCRKPKFIDKVGKIEWRQGWWHGKTD